MKLRQWLGRGVFLAIVSIACPSPSVFAVTPAQLSDKQKARGARTVADALAHLRQEQTHQPPLDVRRKVAQQFGDCLAGIPGLHGKSITFLLSGKENDGQRLADSDCFAQGLTASHLDADISGSFPVHVMHSLVADGLVRKDFSKQGPIDFSAVPPLGSAPLSDDGTSAPSTTMSVADRLGECAARVSPEAVRHLALTDAASAEEVSQVRALVPTYA